MEISFLIGAGFSVPDKYPTRTEINKKMRNISHKKIKIDSTGYVRFIEDDEEAEIEYFRQRMFMEKFIQYYTKKIIDKIESFDYEGFYDFYQGLRTGRLKCCVFRKFTNKFRKSYNCEDDDNNLLLQFHNSFNQLIASMLKRNPKNLTLCKPYTKYPAFLNYIDDIKNDYDKLHFHTLNHDLLLEELSHSTAFDTLPSDGFSELGSPFYSKYEEDHTIRLKMFNNNFDGKFCLYKLHGSVDQYIYNFKNIEYTTIKVPYGVSTMDLMKEYKNNNDKLEYDNCFWNYFPDFLSGTTEKIKHYQEKNYYEPIFKRFIENLKKSDLLITIGYGLRDSKINEFIESHFLHNQQKKMIVITPNKPNSSLFNYNNVKYYGPDKGIEDIDYLSINNLLINEI